MKKLFFFIFLFLGFASSSIAQNIQEVVFLKNGSVIRGEVIEQIPNKTLKIKTADGSIFSYEMSEVEKIVKETREVNSPAGNYIIKRGYRGFVDLGYTIGVGENKLGRVDITTSHGYQFNPYFFIGAGVGLCYWTEPEELGVPVFIDFRTDIPTGSKISPFVDLKLGTDAATQKFCHYGNFAIGCRIALVKQLAFNVSLGYQFQKYEAGTIKKATFTTNGISIKAGIEF